METETKAPKAPSKKTILNKAKYAVVSAERAYDKLTSDLDVLNQKLDDARKWKAQKQSELDLLLAA